MLLNYRTHIRVEPTCYLTVYSFYLFCVKRRELCITFSAVELANHIHQLFTVFGHLLSNVLVSCFDIRFSALILRKLTECN